MVAKTARSTKAEKGKEVVRPQQQPGGRRVSREADVEVDDSPVVAVRRGRKRKPAAALQLSDSDTEKVVESAKIPVRGRKRAAVLQKPPVPSESDSEDETLTKPSPRRIIPQVHYPSELGYCNGLGVEERRGKATSSKRRSPKVRTLLVLLCAHFSHAIVATTRQYMAQKYNDSTTDVLLPMELFAWSFT